MALEPRIRVSAILRWEGRILLCRHEKAGRGEYWLLPGGGAAASSSVQIAVSTVDFPLEPSPTSAHTEPGKSSRAWAAR